MHMLTQEVFPPPTPSVEVVVKILSATHVVIVFSIKLERICKHKGSRKMLWLKQIYFMSFLIIINTDLYIF